MFYLHVLGYSRQGKGPGEFAVAIDQQFNTSFVAFNNVYQQLKYSTVPLSAKQAGVIEGFYTPFIQSVKSKVPLKTRATAFLNIYNTISYFAQSKK
jgi:hypothetical protein